MDIEQRMWKLIETLCPLFDYDFVSIKRFLQAWVVDENKQTPEFAQKLVEVLNENNLGKEGDLEDLCNDLLANVEKQYNVAEFGYECLVDAYLGGSSIKQYIKSGEYRELIEFRYDKPTIRYGKIKDSLVKDLLEKLRDEIEGFKQSDPEQLNDECKKMYEYLINRNFAGLMVSVLEFGYSVIDNETLRRFLMREFLYYDISLEQIKSWLKEKNISVDNIGMEADCPGDVKSALACYIEMIADWPVYIELKVHIENQIKRLVVKLLEYYIPEEELLSLDDDWDAIDLVGDALECGWNDLEGDEAQKVQQIYEECKVTPEIVKIYCYYDYFSCCEGVEDLIEAASRGVSIADFHKGEHSYGIKYEERREKWREFAKAIYSGKTEMPEMEGCEDIFRQVLETRNAMLRSGVIRENGGVITPEEAACGLVMNVSTDKVIAAQGVGLNLGPELEQNPEKN